VVAPVVEETQGSGAFPVVVLGGKRGHAPRDALVAVEERRADRTGIGGVEVCHVHVSAQVPMLGCLIAHAGVTAVLFESHVGPMSVRAVV